MNEPIPTKAKGRKALAVVVGSVAVILMLASIIFTISAQIAVAQILDKFFLDTATIAPGTGIRPMGMEMQIGLIWTLSIVIGGVCALFGGITGLMQRRWWLTVLAMLVGISSAIPMFYSGRELNRIIAVRKLVMEP